MDKGDDLTSCLRKDYLLFEKQDTFWSIWKVFYNFLESLDGDSFVELMDIETIY